eukprot:959219-Pyramimonas_sp.AAC.1
MVPFLDGSQANTLKGLIKHGRYAAGALVVVVASRDQWPLPISILTPRLSINRSIGDRSIGDL